MDDYQLTDVDNTSFTEPQSTQLTQASQRKRGPNKNYSLIATYQTLDQAQKHLLDKKIWSLDNTSKLKNGTVKMYFRCNLQRAKGKQCAATALIKIPNDK